MSSSQESESDAELAARVTLEIRLRAVVEVADGAPVVEVAERYGVTRQTVTRWSKRYAASGLDGLADRSRRPHSSPTRIAPDVEALICEMRRYHRRWGVRRIAYELAREVVSIISPPTGTLCTATSSSFASVRASDQISASAVALT